MSRLNISDKAQIIPANLHKEGMRICGEVVLTVGNKVYKSRNAISAILKSQLSDAMVFAESYNIRDAELFDQANIPPTESSFLMQKGEIEVVSTDFGAQEPVKSKSGFIVFEVTTMGTVTINTDDPFTGPDSFQFEVTSEMTVEQVRDAIVNAYEFAAISGHYDMVEVQTNEFGQVGFYIEARAPGSSYDGAELTSEYDGLLFTSPTTGGQTGDTVRNIAIELTVTGEPTEVFNFQVLADETPEQLAQRIFIEIQVYVQTMAYLIERMGRFIFIEGFSASESPVMTIAATGDVGPGDVDIATKNFMPIGAGQGDKDGISYRVADLGFLTMETTRITAVNPYGARWKGEATFPDFSDSPSPSPSPEEPPKLLGLRLGRGYRNAPSPISFTQPFLHGFAIKDQAIPGGDISFPVSIAPGTPFSVEWEIFIILDQPTPP